MFAIEREGWSQYGLATQIKDIFQESNYRVGNIGLIIPTTNPFHGIKISVRKQPDEETADGLGQLLKELGLPYTTIKIDSRAGADIEIIVGLQ